VISACAVVCLGRLLFLDRDQFKRNGFIVQPLLESTIFFKASNNGYPRTAFLVDADIFPSVEIV
jgi:hypothetical protein